MIWSLLYVIANKESYQLAFFTFYFWLIYGNKNVSDIFKDICESGGNFRGKPHFVSNVEETNDKYEIMLGSISTR